MKFQPRLDLIWLDGLTLETATQRVAELPPHSAVFLVMLLADESGAAYTQDRVLAAVYRASRSPIFGIFDNQVGAGIVGGRMMPMRLVSRRSAEAAARLLAGETPATVRLHPIRATTSVFDGRELDRWGIPASRLPLDSEVLFRPISPLVANRWPLAIGLVVVALQSALIVGLLVNRNRRRVAESEVQSLHGRLLTTFEQERRRLARELHDDFTQRLARLAIDAAQLERRPTAEWDPATATQMREELVRLSTDVHTLSRQLHPSILDDLGLADALRSEGERFARDERIAVEVHLAEAPPELSSDKALCLYRVAQEALRNVAHHARAERVEIFLGQTNGELELRVRDDGVGFDPEEKRSRSGLGHVSLRERLNLVGGRLEIVSAPGRGTVVFAWTPVGGAAS